MSSASRRQRSNDGVRALAAWLQAEGWPVTGAALAGVQGADILGLDGLLSVEHKAADDWRLMTWLREARGRPGLPVVVYQSRGQGPGSVAEWPMIMRVGDGFPQLAAAGYRTKRQREGR